MTQKDQVLNALRIIGGKGTNTEILKAIDTTKWKTKTPDATISSILYKLSRQNLCEKINKKWVLINKKYSKTSSGVKPVTNVPESGLYLITLNSDTRKHIAGFAFKVGSSKNTKERIRQYNSLLPFASVQSLATYPIPKGIILTDIEKLVRIKLLNNTSLRFSIGTCYNGNQSEWQQITDTKMEGKVPILVRVFKKAVKDSIKELKKRN